MSGQLPVGLVHVLLACSYSISSKPLVSRSKPFYMTYSGAVETAHGILGPITKLKLTDQKLRRKRLNIIDLYRVFLIGIRFNQTIKIT